MNGLLILPDKLLSFGFICISLEKLDVRLMLTISITQISDKALKYYIVLQVNMSIVVISPVIYQIDQNEHAMTCLITCSNFSPSSKKRSSNGKHSSSTTKINHRVAFNVFMAHLNVVHHVGCV